MVGMNIGRISSAAWVLVSVLVMAWNGLAAADFQRVKVQGVVRDPRTAQPVVLLADPSGQRAMPIWIGEAEAMALEAALQGTVARRPMTHDLLASVIGQLKASLEEVRVTELKEDVYYALIFLKGPQGVIQVDARPSDAMVLAVKGGRPILVERSLFEARSLALPRAPLEAYGLEVQELDQELREALGYRGEGVLVSNVEPDGLADKGGIRPGDVLTKVEGRAVGSPVELEQALPAPTRSLRLEVFREGKRLSLLISSPPRR